MFRISVFPNVLTSIITAASTISNTYVFRMGPDYMHMISSVILSLLVPKTGTGRNSIVASYAFVPYIDRSTTVMALNLYDKCVLFLFGKGIHLPLLSHVWEIEPNSNLSFLGFFNSAPQGCLIMA